MNIRGVWQTERRPLMSKTILKIACQRSAYRTLRQFTDMRNLREFQSRMLIKFEIRAEYDETIPF